MRYRTMLPLPDGRFYDNVPVNPYSLTGIRYRTEVRVPTQEAIDKIREVAYPTLTEYGIEVEFEADDLYELAETVRDLEDELQAAGYWIGIIHIDRPDEVTE